MDHFSALTQCGFCSHLNASFAPSCELCGDALSYEHTLSVHTLFQHPPAPAFCVACNRRLLLNGQTCAFCNAIHGHAAVGAPRRRVRYFNPLLPHPLDALTETFVSMVVGNPANSTAFVIPSSSSDSQPLSSHARSRVLRPLDDVSALRDQTCAVCLESLDNDRVSCQLACCLNKFHTECLDGWFRTRSTCPLCRQNLNTLVSTE